MTQQTKRRWQRVDGVLLLDKPAGMTSNDALQKARRLFSAAKAGHTGTLDPMATGLLPVCFGEATKFSHDLLDADKAYRATLKFGVSTDTGDAEGAVVATRPVTHDVAALQGAIARFIGDIEQIPPMYSALKRDGRPLHELARAGVTVERAPRPVTLHAIDLIEAAVDTAVIDVRCSKGTYIRVLAEDLGHVLGCGAHLTALRRTAVGPLTLGAAVTLDQLAAQQEDARTAMLRPVDSLIANLPRVDLDVDAVRRFACGNPVVVALPDGERFRVYVDDTLLGVALRDTDGRLQPSRLLSDVAEAAKPAA